MVFGAALNTKPQRIESDSEDDGPTWDEMKAEERHQDDLRKEEQKFGTVKASTKVTCSWRRAVCGRC